MSAIVAIAPQVDVPRVHNHHQQSVVHCVLRQERVQRDVRATVLRLCQRVAAVLAQHAARGGVAEPPAHDGVVRELDVIPESVLLRETVFALQVRGVLEVDVVGDEGAVEERAVGELVRTHAHEEMVDARSPDHELVVPSQEEIKSILREEKRVLHVTNGEMAHST